MFSRSRVTAVCAVFPVLLAVSVSGAAESDDARAVVEHLFRALTETAAIEPALDPAERYAALEPVITEAYDLARMGEVVVGRSWRSWSESEREIYLQTFVRLSVTQHAVRFASLTSDMVEILGSSPMEDRAAYEVAAVIRRNNGEEDVSLDYWLEQNGERWRIVNVERMNMSSEISTMRSRFRAILAEGDLEDLLADLEDQIARCNSPAGCYER